MGAKGEPGEAGSTGPTGPCGIAGRKGARGARGPSGTPGTKGSTGLPGLPGLRGANGKNGLQGAKGTYGDPGATGQPGAQGARGKPGYKGVAGDPGEPGTPGLSITWSRSAFCVKLGTGSVLSNHPIDFHEILYNEDGDYNTENGTFNCRIAGVYAFHAYFEVKTGNAQIAIMVNDQRIYHNSQPYSSYPEMSTVGTIVELKVGDKVWVQPIDSDTGICHNSYFMGYLIYDRK
ncbi:protein HP-25 homolog 1-like [Mobula birostris]|uniref:protein HP-25 homolog 1-like n=1 Tax=Mobula birostris TaxID=1983395 RepID=UPI003B28146F